MELLKEHYDLNRDLCETLRFLIEDQAFTPDFLVTTIMEYVTPRIKTKHPETGDKGHKEQF